jgi:glucan 1,3-beta-glucosidase
MRTVAAVVALVACVHVGFWALLRDDARAPDFGGQLASVSYAPFEGSAHPALLRALPRLGPTSSCWLR